MINNMETRTYKQFGTFSVVLLLPLSLFFIALIIKSGFSSDPLTIVQLFLFLTFLICLLIFYQLTIKVSKDSVSFRLGIGLVGKSYPLSEIKSCKAVSNSALYGIGIRMLSNGWLYNVSGFKAIELQFKNRNSVVRIGTDKPEELAGIINERLSVEHTAESAIANRKRDFNLMWIALILVSLLPIGFLMSGKAEIDMYTNQQGLIIKGLYGLTIPYAELLKADTIQSLPQISLRTNGYSLGKTKIGNFRLSDGEQVKLFVKSGFPPYILIHSKDNKPVYINYEDKQKTIDLYNTLIKNKK